jgi:hypothetical protein
LHDAKKRIEDLIEELVQVKDKREGLKFELTICKKKRVDLENHVVFYDRHIETYFGESENFKRFRA